MNELVGVNFTCAEPAFKRPSKWDIFKFKVVNPFTPFPRPPANATLMPTCMFPNGTALLDALSFEEGRMVLDFGILLAFFVAFEIIAYLGLKFIVAKRIKH